MALPLGKVVFLVGAGIVGSVIYKEGSLPSVYSTIQTVLSLGKGKPGDSSPKSKPQNNVLLEEVDRLKQQLQTLANRRVTILNTGGSSGRGGYAAPIIIVIVVGYGYIWWKGYKLSDLMFATRRGLTDACTNVGKQLDNLSSSIGATKRHLSSRIDRVDCSIEECIDITTDTKEEVALLRGDLSSFHKDVESVHRAVQILGTKICTIEGKQDYTNSAVGKLVNFAQTLEKGETGAFIKASPSTSSRPALEHQPTPTPRTASLPPLLELQSPSSSSESPKVARSLRGTISGSGLKDLQMLSGIDNGESAPVTPYITSPVEAPKASDSSSSGGFGWNIAGRLLGRTSSTKAASKF